MESLKRIVKVTKQTDEQIVEIDSNRLIVIRGGHVDDTANNRICGVRISGDFRGQALFLKWDYDWVLGKDNEGVIIIVPQKRIR